MTDSQYTESPEGTQEEKPAAYYDRKFIEFLQWERASRDTIDFKKIYVDMAGDILAGLALSEIIYWHMPSKAGGSRMRIQRDGHDWIAASRSEWWDRCRFTRRQVDRVLDILVKRGLVEKQHFVFAGRRTTHVRLITEAFLLLWNSLINEPVQPERLTRQRRSKPKEVSDVTDTASAQDPISPSLISEGPSLNRDSITESTAEVTVNEKEKDSIAERDGDSSSAQDSAAKEDKKPRKHDEIFDALAKHLFKLEPAQIDKVAGARIGKVRKWLRENVPNATPEDVQKFVAHNGKYAALDVTKFAEQWLRWKAARISAPALPDDWQPDYSGSDEYLNSLVGRVG